MRQLFVCCLIALLAGCASNAFNDYGVKPGMSRDEVISRIGKPGRIVKLPGGGERLQYSQQPFGQYAWMLDLDASGKMVSLRQVLNERDLNRIEADKWTREDVEREFGPPAKIDGVANWDGPIWTYRWKNDSDMFYFVYFDRQGVVRRAHPAMEFINGPSKD